MKEDPRRTRIDVVSRSASWPVKDGRMRTSALQILSLGGYRRGYRNALILIVERPNETEYELCGSTDFPHLIRLYLHLNTPSFSLISTSKNVGLPAGSSSTFLYNHLRRCHSFMGGSRVCRLKGSRTHKSYVASFRAVVDPNSLFNAMYASVTEQPPAKHPH
jgi:hypothetical protein